MKKLFINLRENEPLPTLDCYIAKYPQDTPRPALLVIPGGGYCYVCTDREGDPIAEAFVPLGFNCFVLNYSVGEIKHPQPLYEASLAIKYIKENAAELNIDPERVFCVGFSAGGHLAASLGTLWHTLEEFEGKNKPTGMILCYPVITAKKGECHEGSFYTLNGNKEPTDEERLLYSLENRVDEKTSPAFIMHTATDEAVPVMSSIYMAEALAKNNIPFEMHIFPRGPHGIALANELTSYDEGMLLPEAAEWPGLAAEWTKKIK